MPVNEYHFITNWRINAPIDDVYDVIANAEDLPRWWPSVYLGVNVLKEGDKSGVGKEIGLYTKGWLPYTLRWQFRVTEVQKPQRLAIEAWGDFVGRGVWTFASEGAATNVTYDWRITADKPLLKRFSAVMKPIFSANHRWAMEKGLQSLNLELQRRKAKTPEEKARIKRPPAPTFPHNLRRNSNAS